MHWFSLLLSSYNMDDHGWNNKSLLWKYSHVNHMSVNVISEFTNYFIILFVWFCYLSNRDIVHLNSHSEEINLINMQHE